MIHISLTEFYTKRAGGRKNPRVETALSEAEATKHLDLSAVCLTTKDLEDIVFILKFTQLNRLTLSNNPLRTR